MEPFTRIDSPSIERIFETATSAFNAPSSPSSIYRRDARARARVGFSGPVKFFSPATRHPHALSLCAVSLGLFAFAAFCLHIYPTLIFDNRPSRGGNFSRDSREKREFSRLKNQINPICSRFPCRAEKRNEPSDFRAYPGESNLRERKKRSANIKRKRTDKYSAPGDARADDRRVAFLKSRELGKISVLPADAFFFSPGDDRDL